MDGLPIGEFRERERVTNEFYRNLLTGASNMAKKQAKSKRIVAKRGKAKPEQEHLYSVHLGVPQLQEETAPEVQASPWKLYHQLEEAGLYVMKNEGLLFVRVFQVDSGTGVSMQVHEEHTKAPIHSAVVSTAVFQKIKE